ncbi:MAG: protein-methionine-sulfoxide reductase catalytic subunit MsrP [Acetobacteraceae bacterium]
MNIIRRRGWEIPEHLVTPEHFVLNRRTLLGAAGAMSILPAIAARADAPVNPAYKDAGRPVTDEKYATTYNNYYEFDTDKSIWRAAQKLKQHPWTIRIEGMVAQPRTIGIDDLLAQIPQEERIYRHRCVEAWAMTVPWSGFPLSKLVKLADPLASAKYVVFETAQDKSMTGLSAFYPWPYTEGLTIEEAANDLAFISTGMYGKALPPQNGGPIRLTVPWKYGFKSAKSIVKVSFTDKRPVTFWESLQSSEYGFWANVNPEVSHPRWSQATERLLGSNERVPTQLFNGYAEQVAGLYSGVKNQKLFM